MDGPCCNWLTLGPIAWGKHTATGSLSDRKCNIATTVLPTMACALRHRRHLSDTGPVIFFSRLENCFQAQAGGGCDRRLEKLPLFREELMKPINLSAVAVKAALLSGLFMALAPGSF
jgi:hypothetical protein